MGKGRPSQRDCPCGVAGTSWVPRTQRKSRALPIRRTGQGAAGWDRSWKCAPAVDSAAEEKAGASRPRSRRSRAEGAEQRVGASKSGEGLELSSLQFRASCPHCQETAVVPRTAEGAAPPPPAEEPESHAGCAGTRGRPPRPVPPALPRRLPGADSPGFSAVLASCSRTPPGAVPIAFATAWTIN